MKRRINFNSWGRGTWTAPAYAMAEEWEAGAEAAARAIAARNHARVCTVRLDSSCQAPDGSHTLIYQSTIGRPCHGGGSTPVAEVWLSVAADA